MRYLFTEAPLFVGNMKKNAFQTHALERRVEEVERKGSITHNEEKF